MLQKIPFVKITVNTFIIAGIVTAFKLFTGVLAATALCSWTTREEFHVFYPGEHHLHPVHRDHDPQLYHHLQDRPQGQYPGRGPAAAEADATGIFLLRQHMRGIPKSLVEVAKLEKASHTNILRTIVVPMVKPAILSIGIIFFINSWNEYVWPSLILKIYGELHPCPWRYRCSSAQRAERISRWRWPFPC